MKPKFISDVGKNKNNHRLWEVECPICLNNYITLATTVRNGRSTKCRSCATKLQNKDHLMKYKCRDKKLYQMWNNMVQRCIRNHRGYEEVIICEEWKYNFDIFAEWANSNGYKDGLEIDKDKLCEEKGINPKIYSPETCVFLTKKENLKYRDNSFFREYKRPCKLTLEQREEIFELKSQGFTQLEISNKFNVSRETISHILNGRIKNFSKHPV